jgi:hypothetical protein
MKNGNFGKNGKDDAGWSLPSFRKQAAKRLTALAIALAAAAFVFMTCEQSAGGSSGGKATGTVTVSVRFDNTEQGEDQKLSNTLRTVYPDEFAADLADTFSKFEVTFTATGGGGVTQEPVELGTDPFEVPVGTYTVTVTGFTGEGDSAKAVAIGTQENVTVGADGNTAASILMSPNVAEGGTGTLKYAITSPSGITGTLIVYNPKLATDGNPVVSTVHLTAGEKSTGELTIGAGVYIVYVHLTKTNGYTAGLTEALHIYNGLDCKLTEVYTDDSFTEPQAVTVSDLSSFVPAPVKGAVPVTSFDDAVGQFSGQVAWKAGADSFSGATFAASTSYTAVVTLTAKPGFTFTGVSENFFTHSNKTNTDTNSADSGEVTFIFPATGPELGSQAITIGFGYEGITVTGGGATIYKTGTPNTLELSVVGYSDHVWYIDGDMSAPKYGNSVTISAADYTAAGHTASFLGKRNGILYSQSVSFTVAADNGNGNNDNNDNNGNNDNNDNNGNDDNNDNDEPIPAGSETGGITGNISFASEIYSSGTTFGTDYYTNDGENNEYWVLKATEQNPVYFAVTKTETQTVTVGGTDALSVTQAASGSTVAGALSGGNLKASSTLAVFTVNTGEELPFEGGRLSFTLTVAESGQTDKTVTVTLIVETYKTGAAVFHITRDGNEKVTAMTRVDTAGGTTYEPDEVGTSGSNKNASPESFTSLKLALVWLDRNMDTNANEYLIRLDAKTAKIPRINIGGAPTSKAQQIVRLRGMGENEHIITHDGNDSLVYHRANNSYYSDTGLITLFGGGSTISSTIPLLIFRLEKGITIKGNADNTAVSSYYKTLINIMGNSTLIMDEGSKLTGHYAASDTVYNNSVIFVDYDNNNGQKILNLIINAGAQISGNILPGGDKNNTTLAKVIYTDAPISGYTGSSFIFISKDAVINNNGHDGSDVLLFYGASNKGVVEIPMESDATLPSK